MDKLNPNHPVVTALDDQWHKIVAVMMLKLGLTEIVLTYEDVEAVTGQAKRNIAAKENEDGLRLWLVTDEEGMQLARENGGLPI